MPRISLLLLLAAAIAVGSASGPGAASADTTTPSVYTDATGDSASAPDLTKVTMTPGAGTVGVDLTFTGTLGTDASLVLLLDTDRNQQTGNHGFEYLVVGDSTGLGFGKWDGTQWAAFSHQPTSPALSATDMTFTLTLADLGGVSTFDFVAGSVRGNDGDTLPESSLATYPVAVTAPPPPPAPAPTVKAVLLPSAVLTAKAGTVLRVPKVQVILTDGSVTDVDGQTCKLTFKNKTVRPLAGGCAWKLPKSYKGARLTLTLTVSYDGKSRQIKWPVIPR
jgi:hypothetical protein